MSSALRFSHLPGFFRKHPAFGRVFLADALSQLGQGMLFVVFPVLILQATGDASLTGLAFTGEIAAYGLLSPLAGYWADRLEQKALMVAANLFRAVFLLGLLWVLSAQAPLWLCLLLSVALGGAGAFFIPARAAFMRRLLEGEELLAAVALEGTSSFMIRLVAPALISLVLMFWPATAGVWLDIVLYLVSTVLILPAWVSGPRVSTPADGPAGSGWREGWRQILASPGLRALISLDLLLSSVGMAAWSSTVAFVSVTLGLPPEANAWLQASTGVAGTVGTRLAPGLGPRRRTYIGLLAVMAGTYLLVPHVLSLGGLISLWMVRGLAIGVFVVLFSQQIARETPPEKMGRVQAAWDQSVCVAAFLGSASTPWLLRHLGPPGSFTLYGVLMLVATVVWLLARNRPPAALSSRPVPSPDLA